MLPYENRLRRPAQFRSVIAAGKRARGGSLIVHFVADRSPVAPARPIVGFVVGRTVGPSVVRHRVVRRLRAQMSSRLLTLPEGSATVVRALPGAAALDSAAIGRELDAAFARLTRTPTRPDPR